MNKLHAMRLSIFMAGAAALAAGCGADPETDSTEPTAARSSTLIAQGNLLAAAPPIVDQVFPSSGLTAGGYKLTVVGENFSPGATAFSIGGVWATSVVCTGFSYCTMTVPASEYPDLTRVVDVQAYVGGKTSNTTAQDQFQYLGTGPVCTGNFFCGGTYGTVTDAFFQCDAAEGTLQLFRWTSSGEILTNATAVNVSQQETDVYELGFIAPPGTTTTSYSVCVIDNFGQQTCAPPIGLNTNVTCVCTPKTCASLGDMCGSASDGCGGTLNCGTCASGYSCSSNQCCPTGTSWSGWQSACVAPTKCTTPACQCQAQGGTWTGKFCT
jgi:hypothetical protein